MGKILKFLSTNYFVLLFFKLINNFIFLKKKNQIVFSTENLSYSNGRIFKRWFEKNVKDENIKLIFLTQKKEFINFKNIENYKIISFKGILKYIQSKFILSTGGPVIFKSKFQKEYSIWHGIPLKIIPINDKKRNYKKLLDKQVTVGKFVSLLFAFDWNLTRNQFLELGEPIYDYFNNPEIYLNKNENNIIKSFIKKDVENILYTPTYRNSKYGLNEGDNIEDILLDFETIIKNNPNKNFIISLHPQEFVSFKTFSRIKKYNNCSILKGLSTEKILPFVQTLIFDYSSLYFQGLYLEKKLICYAPDFEKYSKNRGFIFKNNEIINPGIICFSIHELGKILKSEKKDNFFYKKLIFPNKLKNCCENIFNSLIE